MLKDNKNGSRNNSEGSSSTINFIVLPDDTNPLGILRGGTLLHWMDIASVIAAQRFTSQIVVTASVLNVTFFKPVKLGDTVTIKSNVTRAFNTSLEVQSSAWAESLANQNKCKCASAYFTFVALNKRGKPVRINSKIKPDSPADLDQYIEAGHRRNLQLLLSGKLDKNNTRIIEKFFEEIKH